MDAKLPMDTFETVMDLATEGCKAIATYIREVKNRSLSSAALAQLHLPQTCHPTIGHTETLLLCTPMIFPLYET